MANLRAAASGVLVGSISGAVSILAAISRKRALDEDLAPVGLADGGKQHAPGDNAKNLRARADDEARERGIVEKSALDIGCFGLQADGVVPALELAEGTGTIRRAVCRGEDRIEHAHGARLI